MEPSDWLVDQLAVKVVLRYATTINGAQSVTMGGIVLMQMLLVVSWAFQNSVSQVNK